MAQQATELAIMTEFDPWDTHGEMRAYCCMQPPPINTHNIYTEEKSLP